MSTALLCVSRCCHWSLQRQHLFYVLHNDLHFTANQYYDFGFVVIAIHLYDMIVSRIIP